MLLDVPVGFTQGTWDGQDFNETNGGGKLTRLFTFLFLCRRGTRFFFKNVMSNEVMRCSASGKFYGSVEAVSSCYRWKVWTDEMLYDDDELARAMLLKRSWM
jgi:hypothetical protein